MEQESLAEENNDSEASYVFLESLHESRNQSPDVTEANKLFDELCEELYHKEAKIEQLSCELQEKESKALKAEKLETLLAATAGELEEERTRRKEYGTLVSDLREELMKKKAECAQFKTDLDERALEAEQLETRLVSATREFEVRENQLRESEECIAKLCEKLDLEESNIAQFKSRLEAKASKATEVAMRLVSISRQLVKSSAKVREAVRKDEAAWQTLKAARQSMEEREQSLIVMRLENELTVAQKAAASKIEATAALEKEIEKLDNEVNSL